VGNRWGGVRGYWIAEADQITKSKPTFRKVKIEPQQLGVFVYVTDKLLRNSAVALEQYLSRAAIDEINFNVGDAIINGSGAGKPLGVLNSGSLIGVDKEVGQAAATIVSENLIKMWARMHPASKANAVWLVNPAVEGVLPLMTIGVGAAGVTSYLPPGGLSQSPYALLFGRPIVPCEYCAALGTVGDIILADLKAYLSGTRGGVESAMSIHLRFDYAETAFRFLFEVDGQPWVNSAITPYKGSDTLSPFVALDTRA
jgi:HK97 family phage major capsid protein